MRRLCPTGGPEFPFMHDTVCGQVRSWIVMLVCGALGCSSETNRVDPFPVAVELDRGSVFITVSDGRMGERVSALVDTMSPITLLDTFVPGSPEPTPRRRQLDLILYSNSGESAVPRIEFGSVSSFDLHPCNGTDSFCEIGVDADRRPFRGIVGADVLSRRAVRFDVADRRLQFFPDIAGDNTARGKACDAVFPSPFAGGGTLVLGGSEVSFSANRVAISACLHHDISQSLERDRGTDVLFVLGTGIPVSLLSESAYERYRLLVDDTAVAPKLELLPESSLYLPSGPIQVRLGSITRMALIAQGATTRGPCQELYANHVMSDDRCRSGELSPAECPCPDRNDLFCSTGAAVELDRAFDVAVVSDLSPLLQALRNELRPQHPEVDGILSTTAIAPLQLDIDYPNNRLLARCVETAACVSRPAVLTNASINDIALCLATR